MNNKPMRITLALDKLFMLFMSHMSGATDSTNIGSNMVLCCCIVAFQTTNLVYNRVDGWENMCELGDVFAANTIPNTTTTLAKEV